jgi:S-DNA-T family DNA segregation ATPase FtsK/SpoIIIE
MLVKMNGSQGPGASVPPSAPEEEVQRITDFPPPGESVYDDAIIKPCDEDGARSDTSDAESDAMYDAAVRIVAETRRRSTSWISAS